MKRAIGFKANPYLELVMLSTADGCVYYICCFSKKTELSLKTYMTLAPSMRSIERPFQCD